MKTIDQYLVNPWKITRIEEEIEILYGKGLPKRERVKGDYNVYGSNGIVGTHSDFLVEGPGVIIGRKGTVGAVNYSKEDFWPIDTTYYVKTNNENRIRFWFYLLKRLNLEEMNTHSAVPGLNRELVYQIKLKIPEIIEQKSIEEILGSFDDKIEFNNQANSTLESLASSLFHSWFVRFDPFREGEYVDSELGSIPEGWAIYNLDEIIEINPKRELEKNSLYKKVGMADITPNKSSIEYFTIEKYKGGGSKFQNGDTLLARITPCLENGKTAYVDFLEENEIGFGSTEFIVLSPKIKIGSCFIYCLARNDEFRDFAISLMTGTSGRQRVQTEGLKNWKITLPESDMIIMKFEDIISDFFIKIRANSNENLLLSSLRDLLLPQLLSGKLSIKNPEQFLEEITIEN